MFAEVVCSSRPSQLLVVGKEVGVTLVTSSNSVTNVRVTGLHPQIVAINEVIRRVAMEKARLPILNHTKIPGSRMATLRLIATMV